MDDPRVLIFDRQGHRRHRLEVALQEAGFDVKVIHSLEALEQSGLSDQILVVSCLRAGAKETYFVEQSGARIPVIVLATRLSQDDERKLYHAGAIEVTRRTLEPQSLRNKICRGFKVAKNRLSRVEPRLISALS